MNPSTPKSVLLFAISETSPVGVPVAGVTGGTRMPTTTVVPCGIAPPSTPRLRVVVVPFTMAVLHLFTRLVTLTDPSPVVSSYPTPAENPFSPTTVRLVLPAVKSLKTQVLSDAGLGTVDPLQLE